MKILRIKKTAEFKKISSSSKRFYAKTLILLSRKSPEKYEFNETSGKNAEEFCRIGFTVSKKVGNAVARNKAKRRLREAARKLLPEFAKQNHDYVIIAKSEIQESNLVKIISDLKFCLKRIDAPKKNKSNS